MNPPVSGMLLLSNPWNLRIPGSMHTVNGKPLAHPQLEHDAIPRPWNPEPLRHQNHIRCLQKHVTYKGTNFWENTPKWKIQWIAMHSSHYNIAQIWANSRMENAAVAANKIHKKKEGFFPSYFNSTRILESYILHSTSYTFIYNICSVPDTDDCTTVLTAFHMSFILPYRVQCNLLPSPTYSTVSLLESESFTVGQDETLCLLLEPKWSEKLSSGSLSRLSWDTPSVYRFLWPIEYIPTPGQIVVESFAITARILRLAGIRRTVFPNAPGWLL